MSRGTPRLPAALAHLQETGRLPSVVGWTSIDGPVGLGAAVDTQYRIGSITKTMTAVLVLAARDTGRLSLDDELRRFVPEAGYGAVTLAQLLSHTGGLQSEPVGPWWERNPGVDIAALLAANDGSGAVARPGEWFHYSNLGFALLGEVVARVEGGSWWELVRERLLTPLGMSRTTYDAVEPHAQGHSVVHLTGELADEPHHDTGAMAAAGQAWSTIADLARWAEFLAVGHPAVLSRETLREMGTATLAPDYGLGLRRVQVGGRTLVGHTGSMPGFLASLFVDQADGTGCALLTDATTGIVTDEVPAVLLGEQPVPDVEPWVPTTAVPETAITLLGAWFWGNTPYELRWRNDGLELHNLATGRLSDRFELGTDATWRGVDGYHRGERLLVDGDPPTRLECATFVYRRHPGEA